MSRKSIIFLVLACFAMGLLFVAVAFVSDKVADANSVMVDYITDYVNEPSDEGGVPFFEISSELSEEVSETSSEPESSTLEVSSQPESKDESSTPKPESKPEPSKPESKPGPQDAPEYNTPSSAPEVSSKPESKEESSTPKPESKPESSKPTEPPVASEPESDITVKVKVSGETVEMSAYDAISKIVEGEMGASFSVEALKAQAVAAYTYVKFQNKAGNVPSLPMKNASDKVKSAVSSVLGEALYYGGSYAFTPYHATSSGRTNSSAEVWGGSYSYLTNVMSAYDPTSAYKNRETVIDMETVKTKTENYLGIELDGDNPETWFELTNVNSGGYVQKMTVTDIDGNTQTITGRKLRENILEYALKSHAFTIDYSNGNFVFVTNGYGHGVGMSQTGANGYANNEGWTYKDILMHYYPGTSLK